MPAIHRKNRIIKKFILNKIDNHIAKEEKLSREYVRTVRLKYQSTTVKELLDICARERLRYAPDQKCLYKFLIDAKLVKASSVTFQKITTLRITNLGKQFLTWLNTQSL